MSLFRGSGVALITPFTKDNKVDFAKYEELIDFQLANKTDAIIVSGTTGEASTLSDDEKEELYSVAVQRVNKRVPVIAGTGSNDTDHCVHLSKRAEAVGCEGLLIVTPYYNKTTQKGLYEHYEIIAKNTNLPIILYSVQSRTALNLQAETAQLLSKIPNIVAVKEASDSISQIAKIAELCGDNLDIYAGNDDQILPVLSLGGIGVISTMANIIPLDTHTIVEKYLAGDTKTALQMSLRTLGLIRGIFCEVNPIPLKEALNLMGKTDTGYRRPLTTMDDKNKEFLISEMKKYGLI